MLSPKRLLSLRARRSKKQQPIGYLELYIIEACSRIPKKLKALQQQNSPAWKMLGTHALCRVEITGLLPQKAETNLCNIERSRVQWNQRLEMMVFEGAKEVRILLCTSDANKKEALMQTFANGGFFVSDIIESPNNVKWFELFAPEGGGSAGSIHLGLTYTTAVNGVKRSADSTIYSKKSFSVTRSITLDQQRLSSSQSANSVYSDSYNDSPYSSGKSTPLAKGQREPTDEQGEQQDSPNSSTSSSTLISSKSLPSRYELPQLRGISSHRPLSKESSSDFRSVHAPSPLGDISPSGPLIPRGSDNPHVLISSIPNSSTSTFDNKASDMHPHTSEIATSSLQEVTQTPPLPTQPANNVLITNRKPRDQSRHDDHESLFLRPPLSSQISSNRPSLIPAPEPVTVPETTSTNGRSSPVGIPPSRRRPSLSLPCDPTCDPGTSGNEAASDKPSSRSPSPRSEAQFPEINKPFPAHNPYATHGFRAHATMFSAPVTPRYASFSYAPSAGSSSSFSPYSSFHGGWTHGWYDGAANGIPLEELPPSFDRRMSAPIWIAPAGTAPGGGVMWHSNGAPLSPESVPVMGPAGAAPHGLASHHVPWHMPAQVQGFSPSPPARQVGMTSRQLSMDHPPQWSPLPHVPSMIQSPSTVPEYTHGALWPPPQQLPPHLPLSQASDVEDYRRATPPPQLQRYETVPESLHRTAMQSTIAAQFLQRRLSRSTPSSPQGGSESGTPKSFSRKNPRLSEGHTLPTVPSELEALVKKGTTMSGDDDAFFTGRAVASATPLPDAAEAVEADSEAAGGLRKRQLAEGGEGELLLAAAMRSGAWKVADDAVLERSREWQLGDQEGVATAQHTVEVAEAVEDGGQEDGLDLASWITETGTEEEEDGLDEEERRQRLLHLASLASTYDSERTSPSNRSNHDPEMRVGETENSKLFQVTAVSAFVAFSISSLVGMSRRR